MGIQWLALGLERDILAAARIMGGGQMAVIRIVLLSAAVLLAGCAITLNSYPPYNKYVGQTVVLKEPMVLIRDAEPSAYSHIQLVHPSETQAGHMPGTWTVVEQLGVGTTFIVKKVKWIRTNNAGGWVLAVCQFPKGQGQLKGHVFTYYWGDETLNRAPWEDPSVPADRDVGRRGEMFKGG